MLVPKEDLFFERDRGFIGQVTKVVQVLAGANRVVGPDRLAIAVENLVGEQTAFPFVTAHPRQALAQKVERRGPFTGRHRDAAGADTIARGDQPSTGVLRAIR